MAKINRGIAGFAAVLGAAAFTQPAVAGSDLWWHLAAGREILRSRGVPTVDHFSWTFAGREWMHHEWLWGVGCAGLYGLEPQLVARANLGLLVAVLAVGYALARAHVGSGFGAGAGLWACAAAMHWFFDIRPHEITLLFVALVIWTRERAWAPWLWPALMVPWANLHGGFVFGFGAIGLFALVETLRRSASARRLVIDRRLWLGVAATGVAFLCNPWGWRILEYPAAYLDASSPYRSILEWEPPGFDLDPRGFAGRFAWLVLAALAGAALPLRERPRDAFLLSLSGVTLAMALTSRRFIPLFALCALPLVARLFAFAHERARDLLAGALPPRLAQAGPLAALVLALLLWRGVPLTPQLLERWTEAPLYPRAALTYLRALDAGPRLLNHYNWGGYVMLHAPELRVWIDGRANTLYDDKIYADYVSMTAAADGLAARLAQYPADAALLPASSRLAPALARPQYGWRVVYSDALATVLLPPNSQRLRRPLPDVEAVLGPDDPELLLTRAEQALRAGRLDEARARIEAALARDPLLARGYGKLAVTYAREGDVAGVAAAIERGIAVEPRERDKLRLLEALAYEQASRPDLQLRALEAAVPLGPFSRPRAILDQIAALRRRAAAR
jgi:tetratricopeptide (TPR) repeat protein